MTGEDVAELARFFSVKLKEEARSPSVNIFVTSLVAEEIIDAWSLITTVFLSAETKLKFLCTRRA